jgi:radical SAM protein with 4Fe4S-binding SPASM domain
MEKDVICESGNCYGLKKQLGILSNGDVVPCCLDQNGDIKLGNIFNENLNDILESERAKNIVKGFNERKLIEELCKRCGFVNSRLK